METELKNHLHNLPVADTREIPEIGGPILVLLNKYLPAYVEKKRYDFLTLLGKG